LKDDNTEIALDLSSRQSYPFHGAEAADDWIIIPKHRFQHVSFGHNNKAKLKQEFLGFK